MSRLSPDGFKNFFRYFNDGVKQNEGLDALYDAMPKSLLEDDSTWIDLYRTPDPIKDSVGYMPAAAIDLIAEFEGFRSEPYLDVFSVPTIGYGQTFYLDGRIVKLTDPSISEPLGRQMLESLAREKFWNVIKTTIPHWKEMNDGQRGALLSFSYNLGAHFYGSPGFNTISACLTDRAWDEVPAAFMLYVNPGTAAEVGLKRRRRAEGEMWIS